MSNLRLYKVLIAPLNTEKATVILEQNNQVLYKVAKDATKKEIKDAFELLFNAKVKSVNTVNVLGKNKRFGRHFGKRADYKKAYINLLDGSDFDLSQDNTGGKK